MDSSTERVDMTPTQDPDGDTVYVLKTPGGRVRYEYDPYLAHDWKLEQEAKLSLGIAV